MKTNIFKIVYLRFSILFVIFSLCLFTGCDKDFLDKHPLDQLSVATFWQNENDAMTALTGIYFWEGGRFDLWSFDNYLRIFEGTTDNGATRDYLLVINSGNLSSTYAPIQNLWNSSYKKIAKCNNFLNNIDAVIMDSEKKAEMIGEVKTIRAYNYFYLSFLWGDVPLVTKLLSVDEANNVARDPKTEVISFVIEELQDAINVLPDTHPNDEDGRITKGAALAILGRVLLSEKRWEDAKNVYWQIIDSGIYSIDPRYKELFTIAGENSQEHILKSKRMQDVYGHETQLFSLPFTWGGWYVYSPFNELVEEYECLDGKTIHESPLYDVDNPYENRDPRLKATFFIDKITTFKGELFISHADSSATEYPDQVTRRAWTGYGLKKFADENYTDNIRTYGCDFIMIRYAEVLLSYLEACIESETSITQQLLDETINEVRGRNEISMPPVSETDPIKLTEILRRERRIELAWEGLRLFDLFRWRIAHINMKHRFHGMKLCTIEEAPTYTTLPVNDDGYFKVWEYNFREGVDYLWPIPQSERDVNPNLTQNPGY